MNHFKTIQFKKKKHALNLETINALYVCVDMAKVNARGEKCCAEISRNW